MNANKTYTIEDYQNVMKLLNKGISFRNISEITKVNRGTAWLWSKGIKPKMLSSKFKHTSQKNIFIARAKIKKLRESEKYRLNKYSSTDYNKVIKLRYDGLSIKEISKLTGIKECSIYLWLNGGMPFNFSTKVKAAREKAVVKSKETRKINLETLIKKLENKIDENFGYVLGAVYGDGCISFPGRGGTVRLRVKDKDFALTFKEKMDRWSDKECKFLKKNEVGLWDVCVNSLAIALFLESYDIKNLINLDTKVSSEFLKGLFDSEGTINKNYKRVVLVNTDYSLLVLAKEILSKLSICSTIKKKFNECEVVFGGKTYKRKECYYLGVYGKNNIELFREKVGFYIKRKLDALEAIKYERILKPWKNDEVSFLWDNYKLMTIKEISKILNRSLASVNNRLDRLRHVG